MKGNRKGKVRDREKELLHLFVKAEIRREERDGMGEDGR